jgi:hypothetical protein
MEEDCYYLDLQDYLYSIGYEKREDYCTETCNYFENYLQAHVFVTYQGNGKVAAFILRRVLKEINRGHEDFLGFLHSKQGEPTQP